MTLVGAPLTPAVNEPPTDSVTSKSPASIALIATEPVVLVKAAVKPSSLSIPFSLAICIGSVVMVGPGVANRRVPSCSAAWTVSGKSDSAASNNNTPFPR
jgi:hypothetical protein